MVPVGQFQRGRQGVHTLDHHANFLDGVLRRLALADEDTGAVVPAVHTGRGHDEVADAGQTCEGVDVAAHRHAQTGNFGNAARDESRTGIVAVAQTGGDADTQRDDVLHSTAQLDTLDVFIGIDSHAGVREDFLHELRLLYVRACRDDGGRQVDCNFLGVGRAGQSHQMNILRAALFSQLVGQNFGHGVEGIRLDALCHVDNDLTILHERPCLCRSRPHKDGRHRKQQDVLVLADFFDALGELQFLGDLHPGQIGMDTGSRQVVDLLLNGRPDQHIVSADAQHPRESHAPGACTQNTNFTFCHVQSSVCAARPSAVGSFSA